ncbi:MAG: RagB/SusD family nutrient uptake outer membrane protein [Bacteroidaceae bacterium]
MKLNKLIIITMMAATVVYSSCSDYLSTSSASQFDTNYVFSNETDAKKVLLGVYELFCKDPYTSRMSNTWAQNTDVEFCMPSANPDGSRRDVWSLQGGLLTSFGDVYKAWLNNYYAVDRANQCIEGIKGSSVKSDNMNMMLGEAYCLLAYRYFLLCNIWGDVPYFTASAKAGMNLDLPKTDKNIIYSQMIQNLVNCEGHMYFSDEYSDGIERMNRDFALGMISRLAMFRGGYAMTKSGKMQRADDYLDVSSNDSLAVTYTYNGETKTARTYTEYYQLAKDYCEKLISLKGRSLNNNFAGIFKNECKLITTPNDAVLYEVAFTAGNGGDVGWCIGTSVTNSSKGTTTTQVNLTPTYYWSFDDHDLRRDATCSIVSYSNDNYQEIGSVTSISCGKWNRLWLTNNPGSNSSKGTGINWPVMRYSDVLLMLAEAENELNGPTDLAKEQLKKVRTRAFAAADQAKCVDAYVNNLTTKEDFFNAIVNERAWEFGGECLRKFDLVRWNIYGEKILETRAELNNIGRASLGEDSYVDATPTDIAAIDSCKKYADNLYYRHTSDGNIEFLNTKYDPDETPVVVDDETKIGTPGYENAWMEKSWGKSMYQKITDVKTGEITYQKANITTYSWRGFTGTSNADPVPYLLPISATTIATSGVLTNDGYGLVTTSN